MRARSVRISGDQENGFKIHVPLGRDGKSEAVLDLDDYNDLVSLKLYPNWQLRGGQVGARGPFGAEILVARVLTDARPGQRVLFLDGDPFNLCRNNLDLQDWGSSIHHDRAELLEAAEEFERRKLLAKERGSYGSKNLDGISDSYHPRFRRNGVPMMSLRDEKPEFILTKPSAPQQTRRARLTARKARLTTAQSASKAKPVEQEARFNQMSAIA